MEVLTLVATLMLWPILRVVPVLLQVPWTLVGAGCCCCCCCSTVRKILSAFSNRTNATRSGTRKCDGAYEYPKASFSQCYFVFAFFEVTQLRLFLCGFVCLVLSVCCRVEASLSHRSLSFLLFWICIDSDCYVLLDTLPI
jgi:hypothetical protein